MLTFLLDEHLPSALIGLLKKAEPELSVETVHSWREGRLLNQPDERILREARQAEMTLVTFDVNTVPATLREMAERDETHFGVVLISSRTFPQNDYQGLVQALLALWKQSKDEIWLNRCVFLRRK